MKAMGFAQNVFGKTLGTIIDPAGTMMTPDKPKAIPMPDLNDPALIAAKKKVAAQASARSGRQSTILSNPAGDYSSQTLG